jgi:hypothetical protein
MFETTAGQEEMDINKLHHISDYQWRIEPVNGMHVPSLPVKI